MTAARIARLTLAAAAPLLLLAVAWQLRSVLLLLFAAVLVAIILDGLARKLARVLPFRHGVRLGVAALLLVTLGGLMSWMFGHELQLQITQLIDILPAGWRDLQAWVGENRVNALAEKMSPSGGNILSVLQTIASLVASIMSALFLAVIGGIFLAAAPRTYRGGLLLLIPSPQDQRAGEMLDAIGSALKGWLRAQLVSMVFVGVTIFAGLLAIGTPSPLALAVIAAVLGFVPVIGPLMAAVPAVLVGLTMGFDDLVWIALLYFVVQNVDGNIVNPLVMRHVMKIPPAVTMFALFAIGVLLGPVGVLLGGPITVLLFTLTRHLWVSGTLGKQPEE